MFWPAIQGFYISLTNWNGVNPPTFAGFGNYSRMFGDAVFRKALENTAIWLVVFGGMSAAAVSAARCSCSASGAASRSTGPRCSCPWSSR